MKKHQLVVGGIIFLFLSSVVSPMSLEEFYFKSINEKPSFQQIHNNPPPMEEWNKTYGGVGEDWCYDGQQTNDEGYILVGYTRSQGSGYEDIWLVKTDMNGTMLWNKTFGGYTQDKGFSVQQTSDGGFILTGHTFSFGHGSCDLWLIKTDENGNEQWNKTHGNVQADYGRSVRQTSEGGYIITGGTRSYGCGHPGDIWLVKTDENGMELWNFTWGGPFAGSSEDGFSVEQTPDGGYILTGCYVNISDYSVDVILIKTDENGDEEWNRTWGGRYNEHGNCVKVTSDGGYIISGNVHKGSGWSDAWIIKTDVNGIEQWNRSFGGSYIDSFESVFQTNSGGYIMTGDTWIRYNNSLYTDVLVIETDCDGNDIWNSTMGKITDGERGYSVQQTTDGGYAIIGYTYSYGAGYSDFWLIKLEKFNHLPYTPSNYYPCNETGHIPLVINLSWDGGDPDPGDTVFYDVYLNDVKIATVGPYPWNQTRIEYGPVELEEYKTYYMMICAYDNHGAYIDGPVGSFTTGDNHPPSKIIIEGPTHGKVGVEYTYTFNVTDDDGHKFKIFVDWGDGISEETGYYPNGTIATLSHSWDTKGTYIISAYAEDEHGAQGPKGNLTVTMPRDKLLNFNFYSFKWWLNHILQSLKSLSIYSK